MKRFTQLVCVLLIIAATMALPVFAAEDRASAYFAGDGCYLSLKSGTTFEIWYDVKGLDIMDKIGATEVKLQRSTDGKNWTTVKTYTSDSYPDMLDSDSIYHNWHASYTGTAGYKYRAEVEFYAKKGTGSAVLNRYTSPLSL